MCTQTHTHMCMHTHKKTGQHAHCTHTNVHAECVWMRCILYRGCVHCSGAAMYHSMCVVMCVYVDPQKVSHVSGVRESHTIRDSTIREICQFNLQIRKGLKPVSLHAIDSAWSLLYLVMVCKSAGLSCCIFPLPLPPSLPLPFPQSLPPSLPRIEKAERAAERKIGKRKQEWDAATKRTAARHNERTESLLPDGKRLHKAKEPTALVPFAGSAPGACHQCGEFGHWRRECPKRVAAGATCPLLQVVSKNAEYTEDTVQVQGCM